MPVFSAVLPMDFLPRLLRGFRHSLQTLVLALTAFSLATVGGLQTAYTERECETAPVDGQTILHGELRVGGERRRLPRRAASPSCLPASKQRRLAGTPRICAIEGHRLANGLCAPLQR